jgi:hypothetical protein
MNRSAVSYVLITSTLNDSRRLELGQDTPEGVDNVDDNVCLLFVFREDRPRFGSSVRICSLSGNHIFSRITDHKATKGVSLNYHVGARGFCMRYMRYMR